MNLNKHIEFFNPSKLKEKNIDINIIGVGAVGSYIALQLAKLGIEKLIIWDFDVVDEHNITNQVYDYEDLNLPKVDALEKHLKRSNPEIRVIKKGRYSAGMPISGIVFLEVDSMKVRQEFVDDNRYNQEIDMVIDGRIGLATGEVHCISWQDERIVEKFEEKVTAFDDSNAAVTVSACGTTLSVSPTVFVTAAEAVKCLINYINDQPNNVYIGFNAFESKMRGLNF